PVRCYTNALSFYADMLHLAHLQPFAASHWNKFSLSLQHVLILAVEFSLLLFTFSIKVSLIFPFYIESLLKTCYVKKKSSRRKIMDFNIFQWIHNAAGKNSFLDSIMSFASEWGIYVFIAAIILLLFIPGKRNVGLYGVISLAAGLIINRVMKILIDRPRPFVTHEIDILIPKDPSPSFPSDQA